MKVKVWFFGVLSEVAGTQIKFYSEVNSIEHLKLRITDDFPEIIHYKFRVSLNNEFINEDSELKNEDEVALLPLFEGG
jgi:molybdopterin converting factor small subunit